MEELFMKIIYRSLKNGATDIHFVLKNNLIIKQRINGELVNCEKLDFEEGQKLINYIKYLSNINMNYQYLPQTGSYHIIIDRKTYFLRISYLPAMHFESIVIRILNNNDVLEIDDITQQSDINQYLKWVVNQKSGMFIISGPTGAGKSTTLYALLKDLSKNNKKNIITIEDPIEIRIENCLQIEINEELGITYEKTLKQILRHDPDVIMIGEIRDVNTAHLAITCALTGHLVLTTIHASNAPLTLKRLLNLEVSKLDIIDVVIGVMSQKMFYGLKKDVLVLSELLNKNQIVEYLSKNKLDYSSFCTEAKKLIDKGICSRLFEGELYE